MDPATSSHLLLGTSHLYETTNGGVGTNAWTQFSPQPSLGTGAVIDAIGIGNVPAYGTQATFNIAYILSLGRIFVYAPDGNGSFNWRQRGIPGVTDHLADIKVDPRSANIAYVERDAFNGSNGTGHVFRTIDAGRTWVDITGSVTSLPDIPANTAGLDAVVPSGTPLADARKAAGNLYPIYVGNDRGVYTSSDEGQNWNVFDSGLPNVRDSALDFNTSHSTLTAGTYGRGLWTDSAPTLNSTQSGSDGTNSNDKFVRALYGDFLYKTGTTASNDRGYWDGLLGNGTLTPTQAASYIVRSAGSTTVIVSALSVKSSEPTAASN